MPICPHGSEPKDGAPPYTWINYRDLLGCNGGENEAWFCPLLIDFPNLLNFKNTESFCSQPQPPYFNIAANDLLFNGHIPKLISNAEHNAWSGICQCKTPPPVDEPAPSEPVNKKFPVQVPDRPECTCVVRIAYWGKYTPDPSDEDYDNRSGLVPQGFQDAAAYVQESSFQGSFPDSIGSSNASRATFAPVNLTGSDLWYFHVTTGIQYGVQDLVDGQLEIPTSSGDPWGVYDNFCNDCPIPEIEIPPDSPPPPDACCPVDIPEVPDLTSIYQRLDWLEAAIANLPLPTQIGTISIETEEIPYGVYERVEGTGGGEE